MIKRKDKFRKNCSTFLKNFVFWKSCAARNFLNDSHTSASKSPRSQSDRFLFLFLLFEFEIFYLFTFRNPRVVAVVKWLVFFLILFSHFSRILKQSRRKYFLVEHSNLNLLKISELQQIFRYFFIYWTILNNIKQY